MSTTAAADVYEDDRLELAARIRQAREEAGMSRMDLAVALHGVLGHASAESVRAWEMGRTEPTIRSLRALSKVLGRSIDWFLGEDAA